MISQKLLSEVLGIKESFSYEMSVKGNIILQLFSGDELINIHELAHKVKEWILKHDIQIKLTMLSDGKTFVDLGISGHGWDEYSFETNEHWEFKAGQWLLDNKDTK